MGWNCPLTIGKRPHPGRPSAITREEKARINTLACSDPPNNGYARWTVRLLTSQVIELEILESIGRQIIGQT